MKDARISFIGGGNMARSLIGGLIRAGANPQNLRVAEPDPQKRGELADFFGIATVADNAEAVMNADVVVFAVKPQILKTVARDVAAAMQQQRPLVVSIAAGVREPDLRRWLGDAIAVVRTMPNTPALVQSGATALYANELVDESQRQLAESILRAVGMTLWLDDEGQMDAVTALSGSGPAYILLVLEALEQAGAALGLTPEMARLLTLETAFGTAKLVLESGEDVAVLRVRVTSPGGTTEQGIKALLDGRIHELFAQALRAAQKRSVELANEVGVD